MPKPLQQWNIMVVKGCHTPTIIPLSSEYLPATILFYNWYVPEEERHESAVKRNKEALVTELKLWEGYLEKVAHALQGHRTYQI